MATKLKSSYGYCGIDFTCELLTSIIDDEEQMRYTTYGMRVTDRQGDVFMELTDISLDKKRVEEFVATCNCGVSTIHIGDLLDDLMSEA